MDKKRPLNLKIIAMTSMTLFSLFAVFMATAAWFNVIRQVGSSGNGFVTAKMSPVVSKVEIFEKYTSTTTTQDTEKKNPYIYNINPSLVYQFENGKPVSYVYNENNELVQGTKNVSIGRYSIFDETHSLFFLFTIDQTRTSELPGASLKVSTSTTDQDSLFKTTADESTIALQHPLKEKDNALSAIVSFSSFLIPTEEPTDKILSKDTEKQTVDKTKIEDTHKNQSLIDNTTYNYSSSISLTQTGLTGYQQIGVILEYNENAIERLYSLNIGNTVLDNITENGQISFDNIDFSFII